MLNQLKISLTQQPVHQQEKRQTQHENHYTRHLMQEALRGRRPHLRGEDSCGGKPENVGEDGDGHGRYE